MYIKQRAIIRNCAYRVFSIRIVRRGIRRVADEFPGEHVFEEPRKPGPVERTGEVLGFQVNIPRLSRRIIYSNKNKSNNIIQCSSNMRIRVNKRWLFLEQIRENSCF